MPKANMTYIVVGCGGSGGKSTHRLAQLMAQDPFWRSHVRESVFFLLIDTNNGDLEETKNAIFTELGADLHVSTLLLSRGFQAPHEIVSEFRGGIVAGIKSDDSMKPNSLKRFAEHWWTSKPSAKSFDDAGIFMVPGVDDVIAGAGQVPMVSFIAAWQAMRDSRRSHTTVEGVLNGLLDRIANTRAPLPGGDGTPLDDFNVMFLGSMAGGTGRGCVIPIAFKLKELIVSRFGKPPRIWGYFLNEDCFEKVREAHEALPQIMNSMTGWSELSAWFSHYDMHQGRGYRYSLPGLINTEDPAFDVIGAREAGDSADPTSADIAKSRPFDGVAVIGRTSGSGFSADCDEVYGMLAAGLYVEVTETFVQSKSSNDGRRYFSLGTSVVEIPYEALNHYFIQKARFDAANRVTARLGDEETVRTECSRVLEYLGFGDLALEQFLKPQSETKTPLQQLAKELTAAKGLIEDKISQCVKAMEDQDLEQAREELKKILSEDGIDDYAYEVGLRYNQILGSVLSEALDKEIKTVSAIADAIAGALVGDRPDSLLQRERSARAVGQVALRVLAELEAMVQPQGAFSPEAIAKWRQDNGANASEALEEAKKRSGLLGIVGERFTDIEIKTVAEAASRELLAVYARALAKAVSSSVHEGNEAFGLFKAVAAKLTAINSNVSAVCDSIHHVLAESKLSIRVLEDQEEKLFSGDNLELSIPNFAASESTGYMLRREVRPVKPQSSSLQLECPQLLGAVHALLLAKVDPRANSEAGALRTAKAIADALTPSRYFLRVEKEANKDQIDADSSSTKVTTLRPVIEAFELKQVLRDIAERWPPYLSTLYARDPDKFKTVEQAFRNFFGVPLLVSDEGRVHLDSGQLYKAAGEDHLMLGMATVAARTCRPFWRTKTDRGQTPRLVVQVPIDLDPSAVAAWTERIKNDANLQASEGVADPVSLIRNHAGDSGKGFNPYVLIVYANAGASSLDQVDTLDAWHRNPTIHRCLQNAEKTDPLMPFQEESDMWPRYRGSGFSDPVYVTNDQLRSARWRPWVAEKKRDVSPAAAKGELMRALAYAWVGPEWFPRKTLGASGGKTLGPILKYGNKHASIRLARVPEEFQDGYDPGQPFEFKTRKAANYAKIATLVDTQIAESLDELADLIDPSNRAEDTLKALREDILTEYHSFVEQVGYFRPKLRVFDRLLEDFKDYVTERIGGKLTDSEHPSTPDSGSDSDEIDFGSTAREFWTAVGEALGELDAKSPHS